MGKKWIMGLEVDDTFDANINTIAVHEDKPSVGVGIPEGVSVEAAVELPAEAPAEKVVKSKKKAVVADAE
jgi:hypothetical protein